MPFIIHGYSNVRKLDSSGHVVDFTALRAVGLALEQAHKVARDQGCGRVDADAVGSVSLSGSGLTVSENNRWRGIRNCELQLERSDAQLAVDVFKQQRAFLHDLGVNLWLFQSIRMGV